MNPFSKLTWYRRANSTCSWFSCMRVIGNKFPSNHITPSWCDNEVFKDTSCTTLETPFTCLVTFLCSLTSFRRPFYRYYLVQNNFSWVFFKNLNMYIQERLATYFKKDSICFHKHAYPDCLIRISNVETFNFLLNPLFFGI